MYAPLTDKKDERVNDIETEIIVKLSNYLSRKLGEKLLVLAAVQVALVVENPHTFYKPLPLTPCKYNFRGVQFGKRRN